MKIKPKIEQQQSGSKDVYRDPTPSILIIMNDYLRR